MTSIQYVATLSPEDGSFFTQVSPAVRAAFVVLFDLCVEVFPEGTNSILYFAVEEVLKDPRISINKSHAARVKRMVYEFSLTYPSAFYKGGRYLEELMALVKMQKGEDPSTTRPGTCRSPWVRSLVENVFKQALEEITPASRVDMLKDWVVITREALKDNREISDFKELAEIVLARFDHMELFKELIHPPTRTRQTSVIEVDAVKIEETLIANAPAAEPPAAEAPFEEFFKTGHIQTASPKYQIYPGYVVNYERGGRNWGMYLDLVGSDTKVRLEVFDETVHITILTCTYLEEGRRVYEGGKIVFGNKQVISSDLSAYVRTDSPREYVVRSYPIALGNEYLVTTWKNTLGLGDSCKRYYLVSAYPRLDHNEWEMLQELNIPSKSGRSFKLWLRPEPFKPSASNL